MAKSNDNKLGTFLREVSNWRWDDFCIAETDEAYTSNQAMIFALVRACAMEKLDAIKLALNRIDGKLKTPVRLEFPKVFYLFPNVEYLPEDASVEKPEPKHIQSGDVKYEVLSSEPKEDEEKIDLPSLSLRQTVATMADEPRELPRYVIEFATQTQQWLNHQGDQPDEIPLVKSVVAAHLLSMAARRDINALSEVFDQIDGKLVETIQVLGEDIFITSYSLTAPEGAYLNADGILQIEANAAQNTWAEKLGKMNG